MQLYLLAGLVIWTSESPIIAAEPPGKRANGEQVAGDLRLRGTPLGPQTGAKIDGSMGNFHVGFRHPIFRETQKGHILMRCELCQSEKAIHPVLVFVLELLYGFEQIGRSQQCE